jgi:di/tricarboxylate transporter
MNTQRPKLGVYFFLALACFAVTAAMLAGYFGACAYVGDSGGKDEVWALVVAVLFFVAGVFAWRNRYGRML